EGDISRAEVVAYLRDVKLWHKAVLDTIEIVKEEHVKGGVMVFVSHIPLEKYRVVMPLAAPYVVADEAPVQKDAIEKWKRLVAGQMMALGGGFDRACT